MIKSDVLREFRPSYRYKDGTVVTLETIKAVLVDSANEMELPVDFEMNQVKSGNLFNSTIEDCIIISHPDHKNDYYKICVRVQKQGKAAFVLFNDFGVSKNNVKASATQGAIEGGSFGRFGASVLNNILGPKKSALEDEQNYYLCLNEILDDIDS